MRTWKLEALVVFLVLALTTLFSGNHPRDWVALFAILFTFCHAQIADRMREQDDARPDPAVDCRRWSERYFMAKEALWITFFALTGSYTSIVGSALFFLYPLWRRFYRKQYPVHTSRESSFRCEK